MSARLRVGLDARPLQRGFREEANRGVGVYARELVAALATRDDLALTLWFDPHHPIPTATLPAGLTIARYAFSSPWLRDRVSSHVTSPWAALTGAHDVFHWLAHVHTPLRPTGRSVVTVHDLILERFASFYHPNGVSPAFRLARGLEGMAIRGARVLIADSHATAADVRRLHGVPDARLRVAHLGLHPRFAPVPVAARTEVRAAFGLTTPYVLYLGGIDPHKDVPLLLEAFARVRAARREPLTLALAGPIVGSPFQPALMARAEALGLGDSLRVLPFVPLEQLPALMAGAAVFGFPSRIEGFGFPPLEAMACGTPVVSTTGGSLAEVLGEAALTVEPGDVVGFAAALRRVLDEPALRESLRMAGLARAATFTWARTAEATVAAYRLAAAGART